MKKSHLSMDFSVVHFVASHHVSLPHILHIGRHFVSTKQMPFVFTLHRVPCLQDEEGLMSWWRTVEGRCPHLLLVLSLSPLLRHLVFLFMPKAEMTIFDIH